MQLQSFTYGDRQTTLAELGDALQGCGGWVLERRSLSPALLEMQIEVQARDLMDLYVSLVSCGLQLTRPAHLALASECSAAHFRQHSTRAGKAPCVPLQLRITFIAEPTAQWQSGMGAQPCAHA